MSFGGGSVGRGTLESGNGETVSYCHMFYGVDLERLRAVAGSKDTTLYDAILASRFSPEGREEKGALKRIIDGACRYKEGTEYLYGYALKAICEHIGEMVGGDVAAIRDHPYKSRLIANGPPLNIPYTESDFPEIGFLERAELEEELRVVRSTKPRAKWTLIGFVLRQVSGGVVGREMSAEDIAEDMQAYAETLEECIDKNCSLVSFRH